MFPPEPEVRRPNASPMTYANRMTTCRMTTTVAEHKVIANELDKNYQI